MTTLNRRLAFSVLSFLTVLGCQPSEPEVAAVVNGEQLRRVDVAQMIGGGADACKAPGSCAVAFKALRREVLLAQEARLSGVAERPEVRRRLRRVLVDAWVREIERKAAEREPTEAEVSAALDKLRGAQSGEESVRAFVVWGASKAALEPARTNLLASVSRLRQVATAHPGTAKHRTGDTGFVRTGAATAVPAEVLAIARKLPRIGAVSDVTQVDGEWAVVVKMGYIPARKLQLRELRTRVERRLRKARGQQAVAEHLEKLERNAKVEILDDALQVPSGAAASGAAASGAAAPEGK